MRPEYAEDTYHLGARSRGLASVGRAQRASRATPARSARTARPPFTATRRRRFLATCARMHTYMCMHMFSLIHTRVILNGHARLLLQGCTACPPGMAEKGWVNKLMWVVIVMCYFFAAGAAVVFLLFKSKLLDEIANFFYRVRTNPIMAVTQVRTDTHQHIYHHRHPQVTCTHPSMALWQIWAKRHMRSVQERKVGVAAPSGLPKEASRGPARSTASTGTSASKEYNEYEAHEAQARTEALARLARGKAVQTVHHTHKPHFPHLPDGAGTTAPLATATRALEVSTGAQTSADGQAYSAPVVISTDQEPEALRRGNSCKAISRARAAAAESSGRLREDYPEREPPVRASSSSPELLEVDSLPRDLYASRMCAANAVYLSRIISGSSGMSPGRVAIRGPRRSHGDGSPLQRQKSSVPRAHPALGSEMLEEVVWRSSVHQPSAGNTHASPYPHASSASASPPAHPHATPTFTQGAIGQRCAELMTMQRRWGRGRVILRCFHRACRRATRLRRAPHGAACWARCRRARGAGERRRGRAHLVQERLQAVQAVQPGVVQTCGARYRRWRQSAQASLVAMSAADSAAAAAAAASTSAAAAAAAAAEGRAAMAMAMAVTTRAMVADRALRLVPCWPRGLAPSKVARPGS